MANGQEGRKTAGARRELRLALRAVRAALTHARHADSVQHLPQKARPKAQRVRAGLYEVEADLCRLLGSLASLGHPFSAEDVRRLAGDPEHSNAMGARFSAAAKAGLIKYSHHAPSNRPQLHRCKVAVWRGA